MPRQGLTPQNLAAWANGPGRPVNSPYYSDGSESGWSNRANPPGRQHRKRNASHAMPKTSDAASVTRERELQERIRQLEGENSALRQGKADADQSVSFWSNSYVQQLSRAASAEVELQREREEKQKVQQEAANYKQQLEALEPLAEVGSKPRWRLLEQERLSYSERVRTRQDLDIDRLEEGNEAAHGGNGTADAALITSMLNKRLDAEEYITVFCEMYCCRSIEQYLSWPPRLRKAADLYASIDAGSGIHGGLGTAQQRLEVGAILDKIFEVYNNSEHKWAEGDPDVEKWLAETEVLKAELVRTHNQ